jgi:TolB-like protein
MTGKHVSIIVGLLLFICASVAPAVPQVAVLEAILAPGTDPTVAGPVTDKIIEELLRSEKYIVLDRANVEQVLREKEFQLSSGIVRNEEVRQAGEYLGADLVIVANVSRVGSTYVISARMVDVVSGEIIAQASSEKQGKIDVLLEIARTVGKQISGQEIVVVEAREKLEEQQKSPEVKEQPVAGSSTIALASLQELIRKRTHMKRDGVEQMQPFAAQLGDEIRMLLYTSNRKDDGMMGLLVNLLAPGACIGSWIQGDLQGALWSYMFLIAGGLSIAAGAGNNDSDMEAAGAAMLVFNGVYFCFRPFRFVKLWNRNLARALAVPYLAVVDPRESTLILVPTDHGMDWRFDLNLVRVEY